MDGDVNGAAPAVHPVPWLLDDTENFVACGKFCALVPQLEVRTAQRRARNAHQHFTHMDVGNPDALDRNAFVAVKYGCFHGCIGSIDGCHFDAR